MEDLMEKMEEEINELLASATNEKELKSVFKLKKELIHMQDLWWQLKRDFNA